MESDNENSVASSVSSLSRHAHKSLRTTPFRSRNELNDINMDSDMSDFDIRDEISKHDTFVDAPSEAEMGPISKLPPEVLLLIFSQVNHKPDLVPLLTVCRRWANLIIELLWFRPPLTDERAMEGVYNVMKLDRTKTHWDYRLFIRRLNLSFIYEKVNDEFLSLFAGCFNLERFTLVNCSKLTHTPIESILQGCTKLQSIDMSGVKNIRNEIFIALAENCPRLQGLYAPGCPEITNDVILKVVDSCPMLKRVKISDNSHISDSSILKLTAKCKSLIEVDVHSCPNITDASLQRLFSDLEQLREFRISHNSNVTDSIFRPIPVGFLDRLRIIDFTGCFNITDKCVEKLVDSAPRLRNVVLSKCLTITDTSLRNLARLGKNLHYIHLGHCSNITDEGVACLIRNCHRLQYIDLACCTQLTNLTLVELGHLQKLRRIGLVKCSNINDAGILALIQRRGYEDTLERIHLSYCTNLGVYPIYQLLQACPRLTHLSLTGIQSFLRPEITQFCRSPPSDFNDHQKSLFCVFSGQGVKQLRDFFTRQFLSAPEGLRTPDRTELDDAMMLNFPMGNQVIDLQRMNQLFRQILPGRARPIDNFGGLVAGLPQNNGGERGENAQLNGQQAQQQGNIQDVDVDMIDESD